jgi:hypothetical protein
LGLASGVLRCVFLFLEQGDRFANKNSGNLKLMLQANRC